MSEYKVARPTRLDLSTYYLNDPFHAEFIILDSNGGAFDFSIYTSGKFIIKENKNDTDTTRSR